VFIIWLAPWAGKVNQILHCDWLLKRARWSYPAHSGLPAVSRKKNFPESRIINPLLTKLIRSRCKFMDINSVSVHKHTKKELGQYPAILTSHLVSNTFYVVEDGVALILCGAKIEFCSDFLRLSLLPGWREIKNNHVFWWVAGEIKMTCLEMGLEMPLLWFFMCVKCLCKQTSGLRRSHWCKALCTECKLLDCIATCAAEMMSDFDWALCLFVVRLVCQCFISLTLYS